MYFLYFILLITTLTISYFAGKKSKECLLQRGKITEEGIGTVEGSILAMFAFFLGFAFSITANKLETKRHNIVNEANAIGTAYLRTNLYPDSLQPTFNKLFKAYIQVRIDYYKENSNLEQTAAHQMNIWNFISTLSKSGNFIEASRLQIPAVNEMIDITSIRDNEVNAKIPLVINLTIFLLGIFSAFIVGFTSKKTTGSNLVGCVYIFISAFTLYVLVDAGNNRIGLINTSKSNELMVKLLDSIK